MLFRYDGVPFPDGRVAIVMTEERAAEIMEMIKAEDEAKAKAAAEKAEAEKAAKK